MCNITIMPGTPPEVAQAIAEGTLRAENERLMAVNASLQEQLAAVRDELDLYKTINAQRGEAIVAEARERYAKRPALPARIWQRVVELILSVQVFREMRT